MARDRGDYACSTSPFLCQGEEQFVTVGYPGQPVQRRSWHSKAVVDETFCPITRSGCAIEEIGASPAGTWLVTQRFSGQGEWGYDVFRTCPLAREAGITEEPGYILDLPQFSGDEALLVGAGLRCLGGWWAHPEDDVDEPARGGSVSLGFLFVHRLPSHQVTRHEVRIELPQGWLPEDPWAEWYGPRNTAPVGDAIRFMTSWGVPVEVKMPVPPVLLLPAPHTSGRGLL
jgi:hypothetical protein